MPKSIPSHIEGLLKYLSRPDERANEDLALQYFREVYGEAFTRQREAKHADGYVQGSFVLELKGKTNDWLSGLFQGLAYKNKGLDFSQIIVAAKDFLVVWRIEELPEDIRDEVSDATGAPSQIGSLFAKKYRSRKKALLKLATWNGAELAGTLFQQPELILETIKAFEKTIAKGQKVRLRVTLKNFTSVLKEMQGFFNPDRPVKTVRGFFSMVYGWTEGSTVTLSDKADHKATLGGETITDLVPGKRRLFKDYVENHFVHLSPGEDKDDFFARYDEALDAVDKQFRIKHGIFFTDRDLSKFVMWLVKQHIPNLGKNYLVIDPACGSGNLVTNWRSPLELRHKVVSEIEPELLFAVERRMQEDRWHDGKFTVVPKVNENKGLNFLDISADQYLDIIRTYLAEKGHKPDRPLAFLCNPPYRSDDDQTAAGSEYVVHESIKQLTGNDASSERYCCFLAQMKLICEAARSNGLPDNSLLLLFTKSSWLTKRTIFADIRKHMLGSFEDIAGILVDASEFFDVKGKWPVAFTLWRYKGTNAKLDPDRAVEFVDLTWVRKQQLAQIPWDTPAEMTIKCEEILNHENAKRIEIGTERTSLKASSGQIRKDFMRNKSLGERNQRTVGGLPLNDPRHSNKKAYGRVDGTSIGFMDDLTPCRIKTIDTGNLWFRLNNQFMDFNKTRCFSGPPTHFGYRAFDLESAKTLVFWYALARSFVQHHYPMWVDADDMWAPHISARMERTVFQTAFAILYADNECVETRFPANNPVKGVLELTVDNPMTPLNSDSFWSKTMRPYCADNASKTVLALTKAVDKLFHDWKKLFNGHTTLPLSAQPYMLDDAGLRVGAGVVQIRDYAEETENEVLTADFSAIEMHLASARNEFFEMVTSKSGLNYFGIKKKAASAVSAGRSEANSSKALA
jgi:hypothetical protein